MVSYGLLILNIRIKIQQSSCIRPALTLRSNCSPPLLSFPSWYTPRVHANYGKQIIQFPVIIMVICNTYSTKMGLVKLDNIKKGLPRLGLVRDRGEPSKTKGKMWQLVVQGGEVKSGETKRYKNVTTLASLEMRFRYIYIALIKWSMILNYN